MKPPSLERRLIARLMVLYLATIGVAVAAYFIVAVLRGVEMGEGFEEILAQVEASLHRAGGHLALRPNARLQDIIAGSDVAIIVESPAGGPPLTLGTPPAEVAALVRLAHGEFTLDPDETATVRHGVVKPLRVSGLETTVVVVRAQSLADVVDWMEREILEELLPLLLPMLIGSMVVVPLTVRRSLTALRAMSARVAAVQPGERRVGLDIAAVPLEVAPLVRAVDSALARLQAALVQQRRFTANAAHELRTPLAVLRARLESPPESGDSQGVLRDVDRMTRLVSQLLAMARMEAGQTVTGQMVDLAELCIEVVADLAPLAIAEGKDIALEPPPQPVLRRGNRDALAEAVRNLVDNALRFTPVGGVVGVGVEAAGVIFVRDHGPGVPADQREQVFEPFWRGSVGGGAGLGLAIVADIAAVHHGRAEVVEAPGGGAEFRLVLPPA